VGNLTPLECLVEAVELWKDEFAVAVVKKARWSLRAEAEQAPPQAPAGCGLRLRVCACICSNAFFFLGVMCIFVSQKIISPRMSVEKRKRRRKTRKSADIATLT
jgi:hypothetical protein